MSTKNKEINITEKREVLPADINERIQEAKRQNNALMTMMEKLLQDGIDYGQVPGIPKPFLHQPGAQQLGLVFKFRPEFYKIDSVIEFEQQPVFLSYEYKCKLFHKENDTFLGEGVGSCNNYERKYKYYKDKTLFEDPLDKQNTIIKMAKKRAYVDATLNVTGASRLFTQDADLVEYEMGDGVNNVNDLEDNPEEYEMPFGKNKGVKLKDLDSGYLNWLGEQMKAKDNLGLEVKSMAEKYLKKLNTEKKENKADNKNYIYEMNNLIKNNHKLWNNVKEYLKEKIGSEKISSLAQLDEDQFEELKNKLENIIAEGEESKKEDYNDIEVPVHP